MNILILGSGGREHALAWKMSQSKLLEKLFIAPGNAGTQVHGTNVPLQVNDFEAIGNFCLENSIEMVVVGPEEPLVRGVRDYFASGGDPDHVREKKAGKEDRMESGVTGEEKKEGEKPSLAASASERPVGANAPAEKKTAEAKKKLSDIMVIGPDRVGALLEGSKAFAKQFMKKYGIPTARYLAVTKNTIGEGRGFLQTLSPPYVLKADGLAAGKGVLILDDRNEAEKELKNMLDGKFGDASSKVVIEEFLSGIELSVFVMTDGRDYLILPEAKDYKRIGENDTGPNTGGMGSVSPVPFANKEFMKKVESRIIQPTIKGLQSEMIDYRGFIFFGLINVEGNPYVIEYNVRLGDPETEAIMPRIKNDLVELLAAIGRQKLKRFKIEIDPRAVASVMLVSGGYPGSYEKGIEISGVEIETDSIIFHAGTTKKDGRILTNGGRVLAISSLADSLGEALGKSYETARLVSFEGMYYRSDLGKDLIGEQA
jgi:phosphoribosylamine---glycine ligase